jgi:hypothetical protein
MDTNEMLVYPGVYYFFRIDKNCPKLLNDLISLQIMIRLFYGSCLGNDSNIILISNFYLVY